MSLKGYVDYLFERRRERRALQVAARLVYEELWLASESIGGALVAGKTPAPGFAEAAFSESAWDEHKALIANALDIERWRLALSGYWSLEAARGASEDALDESVPGETMSAKLHEVLFECAQGIEIARDIVAELIDGFDKDPFPPGDRRLGEAS